MTIRIASGTGKLPSRERDAERAARSRDAVINEALTRRMTVRELAAEMRELAVDAALAGLSAQEAALFLPPPDDELDALELELQRRLQLIRLRTGAAR